MGARMRRRGLLAGLAGCVVLARHAAAASGVPDNFRDQATLLVAGPEGGRLDEESRQLVPPLTRALPPGTTLTRALSGGMDGVTGANQFEARGAPDGLTVLMVPGAAALAWLAGDPRAQFDAGRWLPVMAAVSPCVLVGRLPGRRIARGMRLRLAISNPIGPEMAALLALDMLGVQCTPVPGLADQAARQALRQGSVDVVLLRGQQVLAQIADLASDDARPLFSFGMARDGGGVTRDPLLADIESFPEYAANLRGVAPHGALYAAWQGAAAASRLDFALVLPQLTPAAMVALWRQAGTQTAVAPGINDLADGVRTVATPAATTCVGAIATDTASLLELRRWLSERLNWRP